MMEVEVYRVGKHEIYMPAVPECSGGAGPMSDWFVPSKGNKRMQTTHGKSEGDVTGGSGADEGRRDFAFRRCKLLADARHLSSSM